MYIDISSYNGLIDFGKVAKNSAPIDGIIMRSTTRDGNLDVRLIENYNKALVALPDLEEISVYKFSYADNYIDARIECMKTLAALAAKGLHFDKFYLDLELHGGREYSTDTSNKVILAYVDEFTRRGLIDKFALYFNYNYLKNIIAPIWRVLPIWLARYNNEMGDVFGANVILWQYSSKGTVDGIYGNVDLSKRILK